MHIKKCFGEITEQSGGEFKISTEKDNKNTKIENTAETLFGKDCIIVE